MKRVNCGVCGNSSLKLVVDFGDMPLAGDFPTSEERGLESIYPLDIWHCPECGVLQTGEIIDADTLFRDYRYKSSVGLSEYFENLAMKLVDRYSLNKESKVVEIGSNDGVFLVPLAKRGIQGVGFEPSYNISKIASSRGATVINDYFSESQEHIGEATVDLVVACNCMAHVPNILSIVKGIGLVLRDGGVAVIEVQYVRDLVDNMQYDFIYHEHCYYHSICSMSIPFEKHGMGLEMVEKTSIHGGSLRLTYRKGGNSNLALLEEERDVGMFDITYYGSFGERVREHIAVSRMAIEGLAKSGTVAGYGASGRANILMSMCGLSSDVIKYIVDDSTERTSRYTSKTHVPIVERKMLTEDTPDALIIFAWTYADMIMEKIKGLEVDCYVLFPHFRKL